MKKHFLAQAFTLAVVVSCTYWVLEAGTNNNVFSITRNIDREQELVDRVVGPSDSSYMGSGLIAVSLVGFGAYILKNLLCSSSSLVDQSNEVNQGESIKQLMVKNDRLKRDAINRYEHDVNLLMDEVIAAIKCSRKSAEQSLFSELVTPDFTGFRTPEKLEIFNRHTLEPMCHKESLMLQRKIVSLGDGLYRAEARLEKDFEQILDIVRQDCRGLDVPLPDARLLEIEQKKRTAQLLEATVKRGQSAATEVALMEQRSRP